MISDKTTLLAAQQNEVTAIYQRAAMGIGTGIVSFGTITSAGNTANGLVPTSADTTWARLVTPNASGTNTKYLADVQLLGTTGATTVANFIYDRLFHCGTYNLATAGTTTLTAQPSYSARINDYKECEIYLEPTTTTVAGSTVTIAYTNENGVTGRTTTTSVIAVNAGSGLPVALQSGDSGVQKIESITIAGTGTGAFNIVVIRRLAHFSASNGHDIKGIKSIYQNLMAEIKNNACLNMGVSTTQNGVSSTLITTLEG